MQPIRFLSNGPLRLWLQSSRSFPAAVYRELEAPTRARRGFAVPDRDPQQFPVWLWCERCQHHAPLACAVAVILWGADASSDKLRAGARCTRCGGKGSRDAPMRMGEMNVLRSH